MWDREGWRRALEGECRGPEVSQDRPWAGPVVHCGEGPDGEAGACRWKACSDGCEHGGGRAPVARAPTRGSEAEASWTSAAARECIAGLGLNAEISWLVRRKDVRIWSDERILPGAWDSPIAVYRRLSARRAHADKDWRGMTVRSTQMCSASTGQPPGSRRLARKRLYPARTRGSARRRSRLDAGSVTRSRLSGHSSNHLQQCAIEDPSRDGRKTSEKSWGSPGGP